jgi:hypothetical protein
MSRRDDHHDDRAEGWLSTFKVDLGTIRLDTAADGVGRRQRCPAPLVSCVQNEKPLELPPGVPRCSHVRQPFRRGRVSLGLASGNIAVRHGSAGEG